MAGSTEPTTKTKTLPIPTHEVPSGNASAGEVFEAEIVDDKDPRAPRQPRRPRRFPDQAARGPVSKGAQRRQEWWDRREESEGGLRTSAPRDMDPMDRLRWETRRAGMVYMRAVRDSDVMSKKKTQAQRTEQLTGLHKAYASMMVLSCIKPLSEGLNSKSILNAVGMGAAMWMLSPNFRTQVGDFRAQIKDTITEKIEERRTGKIEKSADKVHIARRKAAAKEKPLSARWERRLERTERAQRGGRELYTAKSAAMTEVALTEATYAAIRQEGADVRTLMDLHDGMLKALYEQAFEDGVKPEEIATAARVVVGLRLADEPGLACVFGDLAHGQFARSEPREVRIGDNGETARVWSGEFESRLGQKVESGSFGLRPPMNSIMHQAAMADTMTADMIALIREGGVEGLNVGMIGHAAAWGLKDSENYPEMLKMDNPLGERLRSSRLMMDSMDHDGLSPSEQQTAYSNAYVDAMGHISTLYPEVEQEWGEKFGADWKENMRDFVSNPQSYMDMSEEAPQGPEQSGAWPAGPARSQEGPGGQAERTYRRARINQNYIETAKTGLTGFGSDNSDFRDDGFEMGG